MKNIDCRKEFLHSTSEIYVAIIYFTSDQARLI